MDGPLLSVITVTRDDRAGLARTRASLDAQGWREFEWLVADGGSTDGTLGDLARDPPHWWDSRVDGGPFGGMNRAMGQAQGRYLLFLNGGDRLAGPGVLAGVAAALRAGSPDLLYGDALEDPGTGHLALKPSRHWRWVWYGMPAHHCAILYRRDLVADMEFDMSYRIAADYAFTLEAIRRACRISRMPSALAVFAPDGLSRRHAALGRQEQDRIRAEILGLPQGVRRCISALQFCMASLRSAHPAAYAYLRFGRKQS
ncbi:glycosyltransferase [Aerophototrophica crusticola]|uniref:Glycosyltransferase n=1 Tax=Aerophototrophica crusticola TaxID=1709002 RepID=A0A858R446_9PROT|nr:glycosyltransferase [Rhodospirillaceae bacterium B3]